MAEDPSNQQKFEEDVLAAAAANNGESFADMAKDTVGNGYKMPSVEEIWKMIQQMDGISDEERDKLRESLFNSEGATTEDFLKRYASMGHTKSDYMTFFAMIALICLIFALFGYKLYKSLMEKEQRKQEKLKQKQSKKSKKSN